MHHPYVYYISTYYQLKEVVYLHLRICLCNLKIICMVRLGKLKKKKRKICFNFDM